MSLKSVRWNASLTSSSSKIDTTEKCFSSQISKKSSVPDNSSNTCKSSEKATANGFAVGARNPSAVNVCASSGSCPHIAAIVCRCACLCSVIACHHFTLLIAISALAGNTLHLCKSWALVRQCLWLSFAAISHALPFDKARRYRHTFLSSRFSSPNEAAYASRPVIEALPIRDRKIKRL